MLENEHVRFWERVTVDPARGIGSLLYHTPLDVWLLDEEGKPAKPYLTAIEDDYSRMIVGYRLSFQPASALTTALTLRQAIWRKEDPRWSACGIPSVFYTDHGSDFTSHHMEQVAADIQMELVFSEKGVPRGRGKVERFFRSVDQLFLQDVPGYSPKGYPDAKRVKNRLVERSVSIPGVPHAILLS